MLLVDVVHREDGELPSTPYQSLPSQAPSRGHHHQHRRGGSGQFSPAFTSATSSSTAALIQADVFCSGRVRPAMLLRLRIFFFLLLLAGAIAAPLCEYAGGRCAMGVARDDESLGERGTLSGEGQPEPDAHTPPASAHTRTVWMVSSLSFVTSLALLLYFALLLAVTYAYRLLFKQCCSYDYDSLTVVSSSSTAAHPLVPAMKLAALLFQLVVPTTIGVSDFFFACRTLTQSFRSQCLHGWSGHTCCCCCSLNPYPSLHAGTRDLFSPPRRCVCSTSHLSFRGAVRCRGPSPCTSTC